MPQETAAEQGDDGRSTSSSSATSAFRGFPGNQGFLRYSGWLFVYEDELIDSKTVPNLGYLLRAGRFSHMAKMYKFNRNKFRFAAEWCQTSICQRQRLQQSIP